MGVRQVYLDEFSEAVEQYIAKIEAMDRVGVFTGKAVASIKSVPLRRGFIHVVAREMVTGVVDIETALRFKFSAQAGADVGDTVRYLFDTYNDSLFDAYFYQKERVRDMTDG